MFQADSDWRGKCLKTAQYALKIAAIAGASSAQSKPSKASHIAGVISLARAVTSLGDGILSVQSAALGIVDKNAGVLDLLKAVASAVSDVGSDLDTLTRMTILPSQAVPAGMYRAQDIAWAVVCMLALWDAVEKLQAAEAAAGRARLWQAAEAHESIAEQPDGLDSPVGARLEEDAEGQAAVATVSFQTTPYRDFTVTEAAKDDVTPTMDTPNVLGAQPAAVAAPGASTNTSVQQLPPLSQPAPPASDVWMRRWAVVKALADLAQAVPPVLHRPLSPALDSSLGMASAVAGLAKSWCAQ